MPRSVLNTLVCSTGGGNTGIGNCYFDPGIIAGMFILPKGKTFSITDAATFLAALKTASQDVAGQRIYPVHNFESITDNSGDLQVETLGYGGEFPVREGRYNWTFQYVLGGLCLSKALRKFNFTNIDILLYNEQGLIYGVKVSDGVIGGIPLSYFYALPFKVATGSNITGYNIRISMLPTFLNDNPGFVPSLSQADFIGVSGVQDVALFKFSRTVAVLKVGASTSCGSVNLYDLYDDEIAAAGAWLVTNKTTGNPITLTSVAKDTVNKVWTLTMDTTDTDYTAGEAVEVSLVSLSALTGLGVIGYESNIVEVGV